MKTDIVVTGISLSLLVLLVSCRYGDVSQEPANTPIPTIIEPGLAYGIPCKPPCWQGLVPGKSTSQEVVQVVEQLRNSVWVNHIQDNRPWQYDIYLSPFTIHGAIHVIMDVDNNTVTRINGTTLFYHPVGTLVEQFGDPERLYLVEKGSMTCSSCEEWESPEPQAEPVMSTPVHLLYPSQGLWFLALVPLDGLGCICPEMKVVTFCYYTPVTMQEALTDNYLAGLCSSNLEDIEQDDLVEWHGFGGGY